VPELVVLGFPNMTAADEAGGALWGMLFGLIFLMPFAGAVIGGAVGALTGALSDYGIDDKFIKDQIHQGSRQPDHTWHISAVSVR
jgi:uncharacterized membrane protein